ncbi:MAG: hypothetical protein ACXVCP_01245 [Bdellovibrio sp.]
MSNLLLNAGAKNDNFDEILHYALQDSTNFNLLKTLEHFSSKLKRYGYNISPYSLASLIGLKQLSIERKNQIRNHFENWSTWIEPDSEGTEIIEIDLEKEKNFLQKALNHYGLWMSDEMWNTLRKGQVIELYGSDMVQLYRNLNFFEFCSFSLLDVSIFEWFKLWERPSRIQEEMMKRATVAMTTVTPCMAYEVPEHILREVKTIQGLQEHPPIACLVKFKYIGSLFKGPCTKSWGAIATSRAEVIASGDEALHIHFV